MGGVLQTVEVTPSEDEAVNEDASEDLEVQQAEPGQDEIIQVEGDTQLEEPVEIDNSVDEEPEASAEVQTADQEIQVMTADDETKAAAYLKENFIDGTNKVISTGGAGVVKSEDGLTYTIGLTIPSNGSKITSLRLKSASGYKTGWYINSPWLNTGSKKPSSLGSIGINRPTAEEGAQSFKAILRLFSSDTDTDVIDNETQAATAALATQEFTFVMEAAEPNYTLTVKVQDEEGNAIDDATVTLEKQFSPVSPKADGSYDMEKGAEYTLTVKKDGYNDYKESYFTFNPTEVNTVKTVTLKKIVKRNIKFNVTDKATGKTIDGATVTVKKGWSETIKSESDGSYNLIDGTTYKYTVEAKNYKTILNQDFTPDKDGTIDIQLEKNISEYTVSINPVDSAGKAIENASIKVTYEEEDDYSDDTETVELKANADGTYTMKKGVEYTYTVTASDYTEVTDTYTPSGDDENISLPVKMVSSIDPADVEIVNAIKAEFDKELGVLRPNYATDKNILDLVNRKIAGYTDIDTTGVTVSVKSSEDTNWVAADGTIHYRAQAPDQWGNNSKNVALVYTFEKNGAKADTESRNATIGWDRDYLNTQMETDKESLTWDKIKGSNTDAAEVTSNLKLPQCMASSAKTAYSQITWTSSNENVISFKDTGWGSLIDAKEGVINPQPEDTEVTLTATFNANDTLLNSYVEKVADFATLTKEFKVTVKGTAIPAPTEEELLAILDKYYTMDSLTYSVGGAKIDPDACTGDIQLPRYTRITDENNNTVFENKEITVTSENEDAITINGYRANVDVFQKEGTTVNLVVTFTRGGTTVTKKLPITIKNPTQEDLEKEVEMMEYAKAHYFDAIKNENTSADRITGNLHPFQEMYFDENGKAVWVYNFNDMKENGIVPDSYFDDPWLMEGAGYNKFKSSNNAVVQHENLVVIRPTTPKEITITSWLSSERYGKYAAAHKDNQLLQKLAKQEVSVKLTVWPEGSAKEQLEAAISQINELLGSVVEGTEAGQYPAGTKEKLQNAVAEAEQLLENGSATEDEIEAKTVEVSKLLDAIKDSQNIAEVTITAKINKEAGKGMTVTKMKVASNVAEKYGYTKPEAYKNQVTVLDVLVAWHAANYGQKFEANPSRYFMVSNNYISRIYGIDTYGMALLVNDKLPGSATAPEAVVTNGDSVSVFLYKDTDNYKDLYLYFEGLPETVKANEAINLTLYGTHPGAWEPEQPEVRGGYTVAAIDANGNTVATAVTDDNGLADLTINAAGTYQITVVATPKDSEESAYVFPNDTIVVTAAEPSTPAAHVHSFGAWRTVSAATVFVAEQQERICACGEKETRTVGTPLKATIKVNMSSVPLKVKQTTTKLKVSGLANGDAVASYTSSNKKVFTVDKNGKIKAGKKKGSAKLTITLKSGLKKTITVKVQKTTVKTKKIQGLQKNITLKKGAKATLKPVLNPLTSQQKIKYTSSKKKIATVSSKGVIKAKKAGKTTITVKSGSKKYKITVNVK